MHGDDTPPVPRQPLVLRDPIGRPARPPGLIVAGASVLLCTAFVFALLDWWPGHGHTVDAFTNSMIVLVCGVLSVVVGLVRAVKSAYVIGRDRRWSWWIAAAPIVVAATVAAGDSVTVVRVLTQRLRPRRPDGLVLTGSGRVGCAGRALHDVPDRTTQQRGGVLLRRRPEFPDHIRRLDLLAGRTSPDRAGIDRFESTHLDGPWYEFTAVWEE